MVELWKMSLTTIKCVINSHFLVGQRHYTYTLSLCLEKITQLDYHTTDTQHLLAPHPVIYPHCL